MSVSMNYLITVNLFNEETVTLLGIRIIFQIPNYLAMERLPESGECGSIPGWN